MAVVIGLLAILMGAGVGVTRRARRLDALARAHSGEASRLEDLSVVSPPGDSKAILESSHWHDAIANEYRLGPEGEKYEVTSTFRLALDQGGDLARRGLPP
jgi:hypothetical protein